MKSTFVFPILVMFTLVEASVYGATFKGRVIDADTKEPIEGAVVVATWHEEQATVTGSTSRLKDVKETLTNKKGEWVIEGPKGREMGNITSIFTVLTGTYITNPPQFIVFKPGYCPWPAGFGIDSCKDKLAPEGNDKVAEGKTIELPRLTNREDRLRGLPHPIDFNGDPKELYKKQREFIKLINEEERNLGLKEFPILKELEK